MGFSEKFTEKVCRLENVELFYYRGGTGDPVLLLHGHTQSADLWAPLAKKLVDQGCSVIAIDLHGLGRSSVPVDRYSKKLMAQDFHELVKHEGFDGVPIAIVGHDLGVFAAYAYAAQFPSEVSRLILMEATVPGIGIWPLLLQQPRTWHFGFFGEHAEKLVLGRERIYLDRFWDEFSANPAAISELQRSKYAAFYKKPRGLFGAFSHFAAFEQDEVDNREFVKTKLVMPVLGLSGDHSLGDMMASHLNTLALDPTSKVIANAGHWLIEEQPDQTIAEICNFLNA